MDGVVELKLEARKPVAPAAGFSHLRVHGNDVLLKRSHPSELFQRYELGSGTLAGVVHADHELLTVRFPRDVWTAGESVPFKV